MLTYWQVGACLGWWCGEASPSPWDGTPSSWSWPRSSWSWGRESPSCRDKCRLNLDPLSVDPLSVDPLMLHSRSGRWHHHHHGCVWSWKCCLKTNKLQKHSSVLKYYINSFLLLRIHIIVPRVSGRGKHLYTGSCITSPSSQNLKKDQNEVLVLVVFTWDRKKKVKNHFQPVRLSTSGIVESNLEPYSES